MTAPVLAVPTEHGRFYCHPGTQRQVPSITNIINMKAKPLFRAGLKKAAQYAAEQRATLATLNQDQVFKLVSNPPSKDTEPAAIGDLVHKWIENYILNPDLPLPQELADAPNTARWMFERFLSEFVEKRQPQFTATEFTVWSDKYGYAGTADFSANLYGHHTLVDTKTGKSIYSEVAMQLAAIAHADVVLAPDGTELRVPDYTRYAVLHVRPRSAKLYPVFKIEEAFQAFLGLKAVFDWNIHHAPASIGYAA